MVAHMVKYKRTNGELFLFNIQLVDDLELLAVRANATTTGMRVVELTTASKGMHYACLLLVENLILPL